MKDDTHEDKAHPNCAYGTSWQDLELGPPDAPKPDPAEISIRTSIRHFLNQHYTRLITDAKRYHTQWLEFKAHILFFLINIAILVFSSTALATTARSFDVYQHHKHDLPPSPSDDEKSQSQYEYESYSFEPKNPWPQNQPTWPETLDTNEVKCILPISAASIVQAGMSITFLAHEMRPGWIQFLVLTLVVGCYSVSIPLVWGRDVFRTGMGGEGELDVRATLREWACEMRGKVGGEDVPYNGICYEQVAGRVAFTVTYGLYCVYWIPTAYYLFRRWQLQRRRRYAVSAGY